MAFSDLEDSLDASLAGTDGSITYDRGSDGVVIPGSYRNRHDAVDGSTVMLTLDDDIQFYVQQQVQQAKNLSGAKNVSAVVLDAKTGEVLAMSNDNTFDPSQDIGRQEDRELGNPAVSSPYEPGSVNKIVTAASVIEFGLSNPDEVLQVPGSIDMGGVNVHDAWEHGTMPYTTTGVFGKSSNVGTLMLAQRIGPQRYADMLQKFGLGQRTGVGLPGESAGLVPPIDQWSGSTFSNLPIGQGLSMTLLQMTGMYQAIANDGVRIPPRIIKTTIAADGTRTDEPRPEGCGWCHRKPRKPCGRCCAPQCNATRGACSRAPGPRLPWTATRSPARPAPRSRSTPAAAATTTTSTGSPSPAWRPPTIPVTSSASWPTTRNGRPRASPARRWHRCSTTSPPGCCSGRTCRCRPTRGRR